MGSKGRNGKVKEARKKDRKDLGSTAETPGETEVRKLDLSAPGGLQRREGHTPEARNW